MICTLPPPVLAAPSSWHPAEVHVRSVSVLDIGAPVLDPGAPILWETAASGLTVKLQRSSPVIRGNLRFRPRTRRDGALASWRGIVNLENDGLTIELHGVVPRGKKAIKHDIEAVWSPNAGADDFLWPPHGKIGRDNVARAFLFEGVQLQAPVGKCALDEYFHRDFFYSGLKGSRAHND